jgi:hypothetical protein
MDIKIFSDSSCIDGGVGAATIVYETRIEKQVARLYLGTNEEHTVFEAELVGAVIGAKLLNMDRGMRYST